MEKAIDLRPYALFKQGYCADGPALRPNTGEAKVLILAGRLVYTGVVVRYPFGAPKNYSRFQEVVAAFRNATDL